MSDTFPEHSPNEGYDEPTIVPFYSQDKIARLNMPFSCDCSGMVWWSYNQYGLADVMFPSADAGAREQVEWFEATQWRAADLLLQWNQKDSTGPFNTRIARITLNQADFLQEGDLLYRSNSPTGEGDHVAFFRAWADDGSIVLFEAHPAFSPPLGEHKWDYDNFVDSFTHVLRPKPIGVLMAYRYSASVPKAV